MRPLPGLGGNLFPGQFIVDGLNKQLARISTVDLERRRRHARAWWDRVDATCGPATGIRAIFDLVAMPLAGMLGFRARSAEFDRGHGLACLETSGRVPVTLIVLPWAARPSGIWRDLADAATRFGAHWTMVVAPPFVSVVPSKGFGIRRSVDFRFPEVLDPRSFGRFQLICGALAFEPARDGTSSLDEFLRLASHYQDRVRADLESGVLRALRSLGPAIAGPLVSSGNRTNLDEALTIVYRLLFLLFAESRDLVPRRAAFERAYSIGALCTAVMSGAPHTGLWDGLAAITRLSRDGCETSDFIVRPFNGRLFARSAAPSLEASRVSRVPTRASKARDDAIGSALEALASRDAPAGKMAIAYADLGVEQLGAVYERVLDIDPADAVVEPRQRFRRHSAETRSKPPRHSARRKETGTFYTPQTLAEFVVRRTLGPVVTGLSPDAILELRVVDPAMGSGAFLVAACRFLGGAYERALIDDGAASAADFDEDRRAGVRRLIAERCLAGVDANPLAVQLARLSLWLTTLARGKPLGFLDHRLRTGNSLAGASPDDLSRGLHTNRRSTAEAALPLLDDGEFEQAIQKIARPLDELIRRGDETVKDVRRKEAVWAQLCGTQSPLEPWRLACSLWCARWFWPNGSAPSPAETRAAIDALVKRDSTLGRDQLAAWMRVVESIAATRRFFHWPLEFADVFYDGAGRPKADPGFDAVIGNPPWEVLRKDNRAAGSEHTRDDTAEVVRFVRGSGLYPSCASGHVNLYQPFLERALSITRRSGRIGLILPWGLATDDGAAALRRRLIDRSRVHTVVGFDNANALFPVHRGVRFMVLVASPAGPPGRIRARFGVRTNGEIDDLPALDDAIDGSAYPVRMTPELLRRVGGSGRRIPDVRNPSQLEFLERILDRFPAVGSDDGWAARFGRELNATEDRAAFGVTGLPVIEGKHIAPFVVDTTAPAHRIDRASAAHRLRSRSFERPRLAYRDVSSATNRLSLIAAIVPAGVVTTHTLFCLRTPVALLRQQFLCALFNSYVLNAVVRLLMGAHVTTSLVESLPVPMWTGDRKQRRIAALARMAARRPDAVSIQAKLQGTIARLYALESQTFRALLETFPLIARQDRDLALQKFDLTQ